MAQFAITPSAPAYNTTGGPVMDGPGGQWVQPGGLLSSGTPPNINGPMIRPQGVNMPDYSSYPGLPAPGMSSTATYNGQNMTTLNPAAYNPSYLNPYAGQMLGNEQDLYSMFENSAAGSAFNPSFYQGMEKQQQANITTSMDNQYAAMGLSGSSAELGGVNQAVQNNQMAWLNRQQSDQMTALQGLGNLNNQMYGQTMGIQNQYGNYQDVANQNIASVLGLGQQQNQANNQLWAGIGESVLGTAGTLGAASLGGGSPTNLNYYGLSPDGSSPLYDSSNYGAYGGAPTPYSYSGDYSYAGAGGQ